MATKVDITGTSISASQMSEFYRIAALPGKHINKNTLQAYIEGRNPFEIAAPIAGTFRLTVDYNQSLEQMIAAGRYGWKNDYITIKHFPIGGQGTVEFEARYFHFNRDMSSEKAIEAMKEAGWELAKIEHLLCFGEKYPDEQRKFPIRALGSVAKVDGYRVVPCLHEYASKRHLILVLFHDDCSADYRFLAVRKVSAL